MIKNLILVSIFALVTILCAADTGLVGQEFIINKSFEVSKVENGRLVSHSVLNNTLNSMRVGILEEKNGMYIIRIEGSRNSSNGTDTYYISKHWADIVFLTDAAESASSFLSESNNLGTFTNVTCPGRDSIPGSDPESDFEPESSDSISESPSDSAVSNGTGLCQHYSKFLESGVPEKALNQALFFYKNNTSEFSNEWISIADYTENSREERFYMFNIETGEVRKHHVSHGSGNRNGVKRGDENHDGNLGRCSYNGSRENMTRPGFFKVDEPYVSSSHRDSWPNLGGGYNGIRMDGLSGELNDHARGAGVVMHGANYNTGATMGRSYGCPAFRPNEASDILNTIKGGSLYYSYVGDNCADDQEAVDDTVIGAEDICR